MTEESLYARILNLSEPWQVKCITLDEKAGAVTVFVDITENAQLTCPQCGKQSPIHDHRHRRWRHLEVVNKNWPPH